MDSPRHHRGLVAIAVVDDDAPDFARWSEALIAALSAASAADSGISGWRILVGVRSSRPNAAFDPDAAPAASAAGGQLVVVPLGGEADETALVALVDDPASLLLRLAPDALILASTVTRLVRAHAAAEAPVAARILPLDGRVDVSDALDSVSTACVLSTVADPFGTAASTVPEAIAVRGGLERENDPAADAPRRSLLEDAVASVTASSAAVELVAGSLDTPGHPLLSIVMRTQVRRPEALRDALLCLAGQTDGRFELLLVVHDADQADAASVLDDQPPWLRDRARILSARGGTRSRPLNVGFEAASGSHVAVLDDDDLVTTRWVARFLDAAERSPHRLLRAVVGVQRVTAVEWAGGIAGHVSDPEIDVPYPATFDLADHVRVNMTPFMAFAFPRQALRLLGGADESLEVCEDWDLILRTAVAVGVVDIPHLTAVYRRWTMGGDSYTLHDGEVWLRDMRRVRAKLDAEPLLLPPGSASQLATMSEQRSLAPELAEVYSSTSWRATAPLRAISRLVGRVRTRGRGDSRPTG